MNETPTPNANNITIPFNRFINYLVNDEKLGITSREVHENDALIIQAKDPSEMFCHVEFPSKSNDVFTPRVWPIKKWRESEHKKFLFKEQAELEKHRVNTFHANVDSITAMLMRTTGLTKDLCAPMADKMMRKQSKETLEKLEVKELKEHEEIQTWCQRFTRL